MTRVYQAKKEDLVAGWVGGAQKAKVSFDAYFLPDFPAEFEIPTNELLQQKEEDRLAGNWELEELLAEWLCL